MKKMRFSRTLWLALAQGIAGVLAVAITDYPEIGWLAIVKSGIDFWLRYTTTQPIG